MAVVELLLNLCPFLKIFRFQSTPVMMKYKCFPLCYLIPGKYEDSFGNSRRHRDSLKPFNLLKLLQVLYF